jgi:phage terminase large subunit-like protein
VTTITKLRQILASPLLPQEAREEAAKLLSQLEQLDKLNPLARYVPHEKQHQFHSSQDQIKAFFGGNQAGKTTAGVVDDLIQCCDEDALPERLRQYKRWQPPFKMRVVTPDLMGTMQLFQEKMREWIPVQQLKGGSWDAAYKKQDRKLHFENGSQIEFLSGDQDRDKHGGASLHRVHYDEEPPQHIRNECKIRLVRYRGDEVFTMTPSLPGTEGWTEDAIWERRTEPGIFAVQVSIGDNPHLHPDAISEVLDGLTDAELQARRDGTFIHFAGKVYPEFKDAVHLVDEIEPKHLEGLTTIVGIDPGSRWGAVIFGAFDKNNDLLIFDEIILASAQDQSKLCKVFPEGVTVELMAREIKERIEHWGIKPFYLIDPSAQNRTLVNAENVEAEFGRFGIYPGRGQNQVEAGVQQIKRRMQRRDANERPAPGILITRKCRRLIWEIGRYRFRDTPDQRFEVIKQDDHCLDAMRYIAMHRPWLNEADKKEKPKGFYNGSNRIPTPNEIKAKLRANKLSEFGPSGQYA